MRALRTAATEKLSLDGIESWVRTPQGSGQRASRVTVTSVTCKLERFVFL